MAEHVLGTHSGYWDYGSDSLANIGRIAVGRTDVTPMLERGAGPGARRMRAQSPRRQDQETDPEPRTVA
jgi:hypothetical protein